MRAAFLILKVRHVAHLAVRRSVRYIVKYRPTVHNVRWMTARACYYRGVNLSSDAHCRQDYFNIQQYSILRSITFVFTIRVGMF